MRAGDIPEDFVFIDSLIPDVVTELCYAGSDNFAGEIIDGYYGAQAILTRAAASALAGVQANLAAYGLGLKIFDGYRPRCAVAHFCRWATTPDDPAIRRRYYPRLDKSDLFAVGYIARDSAHCRGSTVDLTIVDKSTGEELDMGGAFDFLMKLPGTGIAICLLPPARTGYYCAR